MWEVDLYYKFVGESNDKLIKNKIYHVTKKYPSWMGISFEETPAVLYPIYYIEKYFVQVDMDYIKFKDKLDKLIDE